MKNKGQDLNYVNTREKSPAFKLEFVLSISPGSVKTLEELRLERPRFAENKSKSCCPQIRSKLHPRETFSFLCHQDSLNLEVSRWSTNPKDLVIFEEGKVVISIDGREIVNVRAAFEMCKENLKVLRVSGTLKGLGR